jgi:transcriptional regulator with XRE-family HTH domain
MRTPREFGERVRLLREARDIKQTTVAQALGYAPSVENSPISKLERGALNLTLRKLFMLADTLGVEPAELFMPSPEAAPPAQNRLGEDTPAAAPVGVEMSPDARQALQRVAELLASANAEIRRRTMDQIEQLLAWKEKYDRQRSTGGAGDTVAS